LPPRFAFGLHPWWLAEASSFDSAAAAAEPSAVRVTWRTYLRALLLAHPTACVGEIGLDKISAERDAAAAAAPQQGSASTPTQPAPSGAGLYAAQLDAFNFQLDLAAELKRPAIIHCVRAPGPLLDTFAARPIDRYPPAVYMHGFTGSGELAASLLRLSKGRGARFYFGVGTATTGTLKTCDALLKALPRDRVVVESDMHVGGAFFAGAAAAAGAVPAACCGGDEGTGGTEVKSALLLLGQTPDEVHRALTSMRARLAAARPEEWALPETPGAELPLLVSAFDAVSMPPEAL
jgi:Tat protein secretion system quality control protein TatD with DNase activity